MIAQESVKAAARRLAASVLRKGYTPTAAYEYKNADGSPFCYRIRCDHPTTKDKWVRPMHKNGAGYELSEPPAPPEGKPIYRLPELLAADPKAIVWVTEGEKCVDALRKLGLIATTSGSATSADGADWTPLRRRHVRVWPDNDEGGKKYAEEVAAILGKLGCVVEVIDIDVLVTDKGDDCVDWLQSNPNATQADVMALATVKPAREPMSIVTDALARLKDDPGAIFQDAVAAEIRRLERENMSEFVRIRDAVKASGRVKMADFDSHCRAPVDAHGDGSDEMFPEVERWHEPVVGDVLLDDLCTTIRRFVVADDSTVRAAALWIVMTWLIDVISVAPIANITAPEPRCGKTVLLTLFGLLCYRALQVSNISSPAIFRAIEKWTPALLIDEVDSFLRENEEARGILNSGHTRQSAFVIRCEGDDHEPMRFSTYCAKGLCGIGQIAGTLADRSLPFRLNRKKQNERTENLRYIDPDICKSLQSRIARWTDDHRDAIAHARPSLVDGLHDRANDCWEPLLAIADAIGGDWPKRARDAAKALHGADSDTSSSGVELLADIRKIFKVKKVQRLYTIDLLDALVAVDEGPWATWNRGKPMAARQLSKHLKGFDLKPKQFHSGDVNRRGYELADFTDVFTRYLPAEGFLSATPLQTRSDAGCSDFASATGEPWVADEKDRKASNGAGCSTVADKNPLSGAVEAYDQLRTRLRQLAADEGIDPELVRSLPLADWETCEEWEDEIWVNYLRGLSDGG